jgi:tetratricopeptide (TPR) repeat protein
MEMGIGMKNLRPVDTAGACVPSHAFSEIVTPTPAFIPSLKAACDRNGQGRSLLLSVNRLKNPLSSWVLPVLLVICMSLALSIPAVAIAQQVPPELQEAIEYQKAGKYKDAIEVYTEYIAKNPRSSEALNWRGMAFDDLNDHQRAMEDYNKAIQIKPDYADAYNNRGELYRKEKKYRDATNDYRKAVEFDKNFAEAFYNMGLVQEAQKNDQLAIQAYNAYLRLLPDAPDKQQLTEKLEALKKSVAQAPKTQPAAEPGAAPKPGEKPGVAKPAVPKPGEIPGVAKPGVPKPGAPIAGMPKPGEPMIPGMPPVPTDAIPGLGVLLGLGMFALIIPLALYIFFSLMVFLIAKKTATSPAWLAFIPIAQQYLEVKISGKPMWWLALLLLPIISLVVFLVDPNLASIVNGVSSLVAYVAWLFISLGIAQARGKSTIWGILLWLPCTNVIALIYLGLSE